MKKSDVKSSSPTRKLHRILVDLRTEGGTGMLGVAVKCVDIKWNISGEGEFLGRS